MTADNAAPPERPDQAGPDRAGPDRAGPDQAGPDPDQTQRFLDSLPEIAPGQTFTFACHPGVRCFNACCGALTLMLTPYDVLRLRRALGEHSRDFLPGRCHIDAAPDTGLPLLRLRMRDDLPQRPCPFVSREGCTVYQDRPGACRTYPLGRATRPDGQGGVSERFFLVREDHCKGFGEDKQWTTGQWLADQGLEAYNASNDKTMALMARVRERGAPVTAKQANMALLALYQLDAFGDFLAGTGMLDRLDIDADRRAAVQADEEARLDLALDFMETVLFGSSPNLRHRD